MRQIISKLLQRVADWYWSLSAGPRHIVGWSALIISLLLALLLIVGACTAVYRGGVWVCETVCEMFDGSSDVSDSSDPEQGRVASSNYYSGNYRHRLFPCGELNKKRQINLNRAFNDLNDTHLTAARRLGIRPLASRDELSNVKDKLVHLSDTRFYKLDPMQQSVPYLVPDAADFLTALGQRWQEYHGTNSRYIITSCLRTESDVKSLKRRNVNATKDSAHRYGTTIDITYVRFDRRGRTHDGKLKADLARALRDMQEAGYCYVKYEFKQSCFHITVRPKK
ncbi:MAG: hypothetical protein KBT20_07925 [Bacteroidales bacterium]|nr:hypothetical protein [Candidatus Liminaster caballi]